MREGISVELARALCPNACFVSADPDKDFEQLRALALWCTRFTPLVALDKEIVKAYQDKVLTDVSSFHYGIILDLTGTERLHGDLFIFVQKLAGSFFKRNIDVKLAFAPTIGCAWAISRYAAQRSPVTLSRENEIEESIGGLPVQALRIDEATARGLHDAGIIWIRDLLAIPRRTLGVRYGKHLLYRLEQSLGFTVEGLQCVEAPKTFYVQQKFEIAISKREALVLATKKLLEKLCVQLTDHHAQAGTFSLLIGSREDTKLRKDFSLSLASGNEHHINSVIEPILESLPFYEEVFSLELRALDVISTRSDQTSFVAHRYDIPDEKIAGELLNTLTARMGKSRVRTASLKPSHVPENAFSYSPLSIDFFSSDKSKSSPRVFSCSERPSLLYTSPQPIRTIAMLPDKPPSLIHWRDISHRIVLGIGPERIAPEWWKTPVDEKIFADRDYFKIQDEKGQWFWIFRNRQTFEWFIHGVWS